MKNCFKVNDVQNCQNNGICTKKTKNVEMSNTISKFNGLKCSNGGTFEYF